MGKKSVKENKNIYHICREECELTREAASDKMSFVSSEELKK